MRQRIWDSAGPSASMNWLSGFYGSLNVVANKGAGECPAPLDGACAPAIDTARTARRLRAHAQATLVQ
jgi:hypothetical protein